MFFAASFPAFIAKHTVALLWQTSPPANTPSILV